MISELREKIIDLTGTDRKQIDKSRVPDINIHEDSML